MRTRIIRKIESGKRVILCASTKNDGSVWMNANAPKYRKPTFADLFRAVC